MNIWHILSTVLCGSAIAGCRPGVGDPNAQHSVEEAIQQQFGELNSESQHRLADVADKLAVGMTMDEVGRLLTGATGMYVPAHDGKPARETYYLQDADLVISFDEHERVIGWKTRSTDVE